jgi:hypothetical protein
MSQHPFKDKEQSFSTRIDHARLFEDRQQLRRLLDGRISRSNSPLEDLDRVFRRLEGRFRCQGHFLGDG